MLRQRNVSKASYFSHCFIFLDLLVEPQEIWIYTELLKCSLNLSKCHGAHNEEHKDEDKLKLTVFNSDKQGKTRQGRHTGTPGVTSRPDNTN